MARYYDDPRDYDWLKRVVEDMSYSVYRVGIVAIENASRGAIKAIYR